MDEDSISASAEGLDGAADLANEPTPTGRQVLTAGIVVEGGLGLLALLLGWVFARPVVDTLRFDARAVVWGVLATAPLGVLLLVIERYPVGPFRGLKRLVDTTLVPLFAECRWWHLAALSALAGIGEELLFRGLLQQSLVGYVGVWPAVMIAGLVFGLAHPISKTYVVTAGVIGIYLGWLFVATDNLLVPIIAHGLYDFVALVYLTWPDNRRHDPQAEMS